MDVLWGNLWPISLLVGFIGFFGIGFLHDTQKWLWNPRRKWGPQHRQLQKARIALEDMVKWKEQRRIEERQKWREDFEALAPPAREAKHLTNDLLLRAMMDEPEPVKTESRAAFDKHVADEARARQVHVSEQGKPYVILNTDTGGTIRITPPGVIPKPTPPTDPTSVRWTVQMGQHAGLTCQSSRSGDLLIDKQDRIIRTYADGHYTTCPYECDCPKWARRRA